MESNEMILIHTVEKFVKAAQNDQYLFDLLPDFLSALKEEIEEDASIISWGTDTDFDRIAAAFIANHAYDLLSSGKYCIQGTINYLGPGRQLLQIYRYTMKWALENRYITQEEIEAEYLNLRKQMRYSS